MTKPFTWQLSACACAVLLAACGSSSAPKDLPVNVAISSTNTTEKTDSTSTATADSVSTTTDNAGTTTDNTSTTDTNSSNNSTDTSNTGSTGNTTGNTSENKTETIIQYQDTPFSKNMTFDDGFQWGGVATQQPHLRDTKHVLSGGQLDKVVVDGEEIMLFKATHTPRINVMTSGGIKDEEVDGQIIRKYSNAVHQSTRGGYSYTWFGIINKPREDVKWEDGTTEHIDTMIAHGKLTPKEEVPTTGTAKYNGHAIYYTNGVPSFPATDKSNRILPIDPDKKLGTTQFDVNYGEKTITGTIKDDAKEAADIALQGKIDGNSFEGSKAQKYNGKDVNVEMKGRFFGPNAAELGGVFNSRENDDILGAFGAKKAK
ncbi:transferrin-binding protein-like solute binding protein [Alysiella filiformis]|uniref:Transferrin binding protein-like solute binding protein n=1 Tax=Alysiella filiformis DSM 16848 TaxID=1120981 RepID=A0A286E2D3_9NEIS|nr:transferrin-binding protein-like solute binding protein [Alysiella filiformis]QMT30884.1 transferrin-binding protein-like solute binding protein [Alysiella filiformis]UBQ56131.1 transferrin-binding protein-like solute binding protein [Alysiella filiformis DSM 16848]SOD65055.1 Transferrin binding protein-like solute binding protein [Alysiella filiformis DSM 16848]